MWSVWVWLAYVDAIYSVWHIYLFVCKSLRRANYYSLDVCFHCGLFNSVCYALALISTFIFAFDRVHCIAMVGQTMHNLMQRNCDVPHICFNGFHCFVISKLTVRQYAVSIRCADNEPSHNAHSCALLGVCVCVFVWVFFSLYNVASLLISRLSFCALLCAPVWLGRRFFSSLISC